MTLYGAIEAGGTKFVCAVGSGPDDLRAETRFPTTTPDETLDRTISFFRAQQDALGEPLAALGVGSFGPVDVNPASPTFGFVTTTPKPGWVNANVVGRLRQAFPVPVGFDTDVNAAALGEHRWGAAQGLTTFIYLTIGTGLGGGGMVEGRLIHGLVHPEMGHIRIPHDWAADPFPGACPYHGDCFEGLAAGPALERRLQQRGETIPQNHPVWALEAHYIAMGLVNFILTLSPQRLILGGGVMQQAHLFPMIRREVVILLADYVRAAEITERSATYIVPPGLGGRSGVLGALALAQSAR